MDSGTGFYIYIDGKGPEKRIGKRCNYAITYVDDAYFTTDKCKIEIKSSRSQSVTVK